jgi:copper transport protein
LGIAHVFAQAALTETQPVDDAVLQHPPAVVTLRFNQTVTPVTFKLLPPNGAVKALKHVTESDDTVTINLPVSTVQGTYLVSWKVVSADGHFTDGAITFSLGERSGICIAPVVNAAISLGASKRGSN